MRWKGSCTRAPFRSAEASPGATAVRMDNALRPVTVMAARRAEGARPEAGAGARQEMDVTADTQDIAVILVLLYFNI